MDKDKKISIQEDIIQRLTKENHELSEKVKTLQTEICVVQNKALSDKQETKKLVDEVAAQKEEFEKLIEQLKKSKLEYNTALKEIAKIKKKYEKELSYVVSDIKKNI